MVHFSKFINEDKRISDVDRPIDLANSLIRMHNMKSKKTYKFIDLQKYKNRYGNMDGYLYVANSNEGIRINFKNNELYSISSWEKYGSWAPDKTLLFNGKLGQKELLSMYNKLNVCLETRVNLPYYTPRNHAVCDTVNELLTELGFSGPWHPKQIETWLGVWGITLEQYWNHCGFGEYSDENVLKYTREHLDEFVMISKQDIEWLQNEVAEAEDKYTKKLNGEFEDEDKNDPELVKIDGMDVIKDVPEKVEENPQSVKSDEELANELIADPLPVFRQLNTYALMVARGFNTALLITGQGGVGKSYNVNKILSTYGKKGVDYVIMKGKSSVPAMYKFLYDNYDKIVVFDDCDSVLQNNDGLNILKGVLDSSDVREVSWNTSGNNIVDTFGCETHEEIEERLKAWSDEHKGKIGVPNYFRFMGACIFISNLNRSDLEKSPSMQALIGRCTAVDIQLLASDIILRIESVLPQKKIYNMRGQDISNPEIKQEVFDFMKSPEFMDDPRIKNSKISFRLFDKIYMFRYAGLQNWKEMAYCV
jgi:Protein of unknown function (DUF815).